MATMATEPDPTATTMATTPASQRIPYGSMDHFSIPTTTAAPSTSTSTAIAIATAPSNMEAVDHHLETISVTGSSQCVSSTCLKDDEENKEEEDDDTREYTTVYCPTILTQCCCRRQRRRRRCNPFRQLTVRTLALQLSLYLNIAITLWKLVAYLQTYSLSVLAALLDSVLDVVSQVVLNYTEQHSGRQKRSSAFYPAGASRLEPVGVLTCAALMGMASFEVLKESVTTLIRHVLSHGGTGDVGSALQPNLSSVAGMVLIVIIKLALLWLCRLGAVKRTVSSSRTIGHGATPTGGAVPTTPPPTTATRLGATTTNTTASTASSKDDTSCHNEADYENTEAAIHDDGDESLGLLLPQGTTPKVTPPVGDGAGDDSLAPPNPRSESEQIWADPTLEALAQDHWNDCLSNGVAAFALVMAAHDTRLWFLDPIGAIIISLYIIYSWFTTGREQIEHLTGKSAPEEFIEELVDLANSFDERITVDTVRAYHFGPKFLVEIEIVMHASTLLFESHDVGMDLQYEIEGREEVERCFVHIDYQTRPYDEHVVSKVPELRDKYMKELSDHTLMRSSRSV